MTQLFWLFFPVFFFFFLPKKTVAFQSYTYTHGKWNTPYFLHRLLLSQFTGKERPAPPRPLFPHPRKLENKSSRKREATQSRFLSPHMLAVAAKLEVEGELPVWLAQVNWVRSCHQNMRRKMFWVRTEPQWRFDAVPPYGPVPGLFLGSLQYFGSWVHSTSRTTAGFHHIGSCPILPPSPAGLLGPIQDTAEPQSQGELWRSAPLGSASLGIAAWRCVAAPAAS